VAVIRDARAPALPRCGMPPTRPLDSEASRPPEPLAGRGFRVRRDRAVTLGTDVAELAASRRLHDLDGSTYHGQGRGGG